MKFILYSTILTLLFIGCDTKKKEIKYKKNSKGLFEGEIVFQQGNNGFVDSEVKFIISDTIIIREHFIKGWAIIPDEKAGMIINIKEKRITLYIYEGSDLVNKFLGLTEYDGITCNLTFAEFRKYVDRFGFSSDYDVHPYDFLFSYLKEYKKVVTRNNVLSNLDLALDFTVYSDAKVWQDVFTSKKINVNKEILPLLFPNIPKDIGFPLMSRVYEPHSDKELDNLSDKDIDDMIASDIKAVIKRDNTILKIIQRKISRNEVVNDLSNYRTTDPMYIFDRRTRSSGGSSFDFD